MDPEKIVKSIVSEVNRTLGYYEKSYSSVRRTPDSYQERCEDFREYIERRFNYEASRIPELSKVVLETEGHLFVCTEVEGSDEEKRKFKKAVVTLIDINLLRDEDQNLKDEITQIKELLGGDRISFNSVRKKIKITIEYNNDE